MLHKKTSPKTSDTNMMVFMNQNHAVCYVIAGGSYVKVFVRSSLRVTIQC